MLAFDLFKENHDRWLRKELNPLVIDLETTIENGSPMPQRRARIVMAGFQYRGVRRVFSSASDFFVTLDRVIGDDDFIIVGHNIKFDLLHLLWADKVALETGLLGKIKQAGVWDTAQYEYLDSGQSVTFPSLEYSCKKRNLPVGKDPIGEQYFSKGLGADHVPKEQLSNYLNQDLNITNLLFEAQLAASDTSMLNLMYVQGWALLAYTRMEYYGLPIDRNSLNDMARVLENSTTRRQQIVDQWIAAQLGLSTTIKCTNRVLSTVFFGEPGVPEKVKRVIGKYKNGKPKYKTVEELVKPSRRLIDPAELFGDETPMHNKFLGWRLDDKVLSDIEKLGGEPGKIAAIIRAQRKDEKILGTYLEPFAEMMVLSASGNATIHHTINTTATGTGRTSSSNPNGQNLPEEVRGLVKSPPLKIVEVDFKQLEMCIAAELSGDPQLIHDVNHGDVHYETGKQVMGWTSPADMCKESRRTVKAANFGTIYGGSPMGISVQTGIDKSLITALQDSFASRYSVFAAWQKGLIRRITKTPGTGEPTFTSDGRGCYLHFWKSPSGRKYAYRDRPRPWDGKLGPVPSEIVNYPVQGFATADIMPLFVGLLCGIVRPYWCTPINMVHDSVVLLADEKSKALVEKKIREVIEALPEAIYLVYGIRMNTELKVDIEWSDAWK